MPAKPSVSARSLPCVYACFLAHQVLPVAAGPAANLDLLAGERARNASEPRFDPALRGHAGDDGKGTHLAGREHLVGPEQDRGGAPRVLLRLGHLRALPSGDRQGDRSVEAFEVRAGLAEGVEGALQACAGRGPDGALEVGRTRACGPERALMENHGVLVAVQQLLGELRRRLDACRGLETAQEAGVPGPELPEPRKLRGRRPRSTANPGAEHVTLGGSAGIDEPDHQGDGGQAAQQTQQEPNDKTPGAHPLGTPDQATEVRDNRREGGLCPPSPQSPYEEAIPTKVTRRRRDFRR